MSEDLGRLQAALRAETPQPPPGAQTRAQAAALAAFDRHRQGIRDRQRQTGRVADGATTWLRRLAMTFSRPYPVLASVAALLLVAGVVSYMTLSGSPPETSLVSAPEDTADPPAEAVAVASQAEHAVEPAAVAELAEAVADAAQAETSIEPAAIAEPAALTEAAMAEARQADEAVEPVGVAELAEPMEVAMAEVRQADEAINVSTAPEPRVRVRLSEESGLHMVQSEDRTRSAQTQDAPFAGHRDQGRDRFEPFDPNPVKVAAEEPVSTFSIDVDTAAYAFMRASLNRGVLPQPDAVRVEELINYFPYDYAPPESPARPFAAHVSLMPTPWNEATQLMHIGIKGYALTPEVRPPANLVFLVDTSGSMDEPNKLPLLVNSLKLLLDALAPEDTVAIVAYAGAAGTVLEPTPVAERGRVAAALENLWAEGTTAGAEGIRQAYLLAEQHFVEDGVNRVILATDGDFNVGITDLNELEGYVARKRAGGVFLSVLGFGMGNYNDALMQRLAQNGNGAAAYIDTLSEARKVLVEEATSTLFPIAKDVKIQVEFNPALVSEYRLIGYETRMLDREDFRNDKVDAGEIGSGHTVTALYEVTPVGSGAERIAPPRYGEGEAAPRAGYGDEIANVAIRYKMPEGGTSMEIARHVTVADAVDDVADAPADMRFAAAVAAFGELLRGGRYTEAYGYDDVIAAAKAAKGQDPFGYRAEFVTLVRLAGTAAVMEPLRR